MMGQVKVIDGCQRGNIRDKKKQERSFELNKVWNPHEGRLHKELVGQEDGGKVQETTSI